MRADVVGMEWIQLVAGLLSIIAVVAAWLGWDRPRKARKVAQIQGDLEVWRSLPGGTAKRDLLAKIERDVRAFIELDSRPLTKDQIWLRVSLTGLALTLAYTATLVISPTEGMSTEQAVEGFWAAFRLALMIGILGTFIVMLTLLGMWLSQWLKSRRRRDLSPPA